MQAVSQSQDPGIVAPERIITSTRTDFRAAVLSYMEQMDADAGAITIDLSNTVELDASGLGILVLIQKRAKERGLSTRLRRTPERVRNLLKLTMLDFLFELVD